MAAMDIVPMQGGNTFGTWPTRRYQVAASATLIYPGEPCKLSTVYATKSADAEPTTAAPTFLGIAANTSTNTAAADGWVDIYLPLPGQVYLAKAKTAASVATQTLYNALMLNATPVLLDLASSTYTIDTDVTGATYGLIIEPLDVNAFPNMVAFSIRMKCTYIA